MTSTLDLDGGGRFFLPGPTEVHPDVLTAQAAQPIGHRGPAMQELMRELQEGLRVVFRTERPVIVSTSSATGLMEAGVRNAAPSRQLALVNGAFSERFAAIGEACGVEVERLEVPWGQAHDPEAVAERMSGGDFDVLTVVHSETSTGVLNPLEAIARAARQAQPDVLILVDAVTGVGGADVRPDEWGLDFVLTGSQKALALPPGLAFAVASPRMVARSAVAPAKGVYFDLIEHLERLERHQSPTTPAVTLLYALRAQLRRVLAEGMEVRIARHVAQAERTGGWVADWARSGLALSVLAQVGRRSPTVTCVTLPAPLEGPDLVRRLAERGWVIGTGYGRLASGSIRIGHMGDHSDASLEALLGDLDSAMGEALAQSGQPLAGAGR